MCSLDRQYFRGGNDCSTSQAGFEKKVPGKMSLTGIFVRDLAVICGLETPGHIASHARVLVIKQS